MKDKPKGWTEKDEDDLTNLVDEIFRVCGPQAVADTRKACETVEKVAKKAHKSTSRNMKPDCRKSDTEMVQ